jgi:hypothetical protein
MTSNLDPVKFNPGTPVLQETDQPESTQGSTSNQSRLISKVLAPAVRLWLKSQLSEVEDLQLSIEAGDRQLLSGAVGRVSLAARKAVYQGLHLSWLQVVGENIRTNLSQVLRGKPFRLLEAFPLQGEVRLQESDLAASLQAPLLANAVLDFLQQFLLTTGATDALEPSSQIQQPLQFQDPQVTLSQDQITLKTTLMSCDRTIPLTFRTGLQVERGNCLRLHQPHWVPASGETAWYLEDLTFELGSHVWLEHLSLETGQVRCRGQIMVFPE